MIDDAGLFNEKLQEWEDFYNYATSRRSRRPDPLRATKNQDNDSGRQVIDLRHEIG